MKSRKSWWSIVGAIIGESILFIEIAVELYTGEITSTELIEMFVFCLLLTVVLYSLIKRRRRKNKK